MNFMYRLCCSSIDMLANQVYNPVTQRDAINSTTNTRKAEADRESSKIIASLTMIFLPNTLLSLVS